MMDQLNTEPKHNTDRAQAKQGFRLYDIMISNKNWGSMGDSF